MPLISEAYYLARGLQVPQLILNEGGRVINLGDSISQATYNRMVTAVADYLRQDGNIDLLTRTYDRDTHPTDQLVGHIDGISQVKLFESVEFEGLPLVIKLETAIHLRYP
jgi:hypothetical protein